MALLDGLDESVLSRATRVHVAAAQLEAGEPEGCLTAMSAGGAPEFAGVEPGRRAWLYAILARAELALGRPAAAAEWVAARRGGRGRAGPAATRRPPCCARARSSTLDAAADAGGPRAARRAAALRAAELADSVGAVIQAGRARTLAGRAARRRGRAAPARARRGRARRRAARCGCATRPRASCAGAASRPARGGGVARGGEGLDSLSRARARGRRPGRARPHQQGDRGRAVPVREDRREPHEPALRQARRALARGGRRGRRAASAGTSDPRE